MKDNAERKMTTQNNVPNKLYDVAQIRTVLIKLPIILAGLAKECIINDVCTDNICNEIQLILRQLTTLCDLLKVNLKWALKRKIALNELRYDEKKVRNGSCQKYTEYFKTTELHSITYKSTIDTLVPDEELQASSVFDSNTIKIIQEQLAIFNKKRGWCKTHTPRNIVLCLMSEIGELSQLFQWLPDNKITIDNVTIDQACQEIADIIIYLLNLASACEITFDNKKMERGKEFKYEMTVHKKCSFCNIKHQSNGEV